MDESFDNLTYRDKWKRRWELLLGLVWGFGFVLRIQALGLSVQGVGRKV